MHIKFQNLPFYLFFIVSKKLITFYIYPLCDLMWCLALNAAYSPKFTYFYLDPPLFKTHIYVCLVNISIWKSDKHFKVNMSEIELLNSSLKMCSCLLLLHLSKWSIQIVQAKTKSLLWLLFLTHIQPISKAYMSAFQHTSQIPFCCCHSPLLP